MDSAQMKELNQFLTALGQNEEPMGLFYTDTEPVEGFTPNPMQLPSIEKEATGEIDWNALFKDWSCVIGKIWLARKKKSAAFFDRERFGCLGGAFFLGFLKPQLEFIIHYVSTGIPNVVQGERYLESPEITRRFYETIDPVPAPKRFCVIKPLSLFKDDETPVLVIFFARPEVISGLHQLAMFVTNDVEAVMSPWGAGCSDIVTWPLKYQKQRKLKAVVGGWDPSCRKFLKTDEITFSMPYEMYQRMIRRWPESFLTTEAWKKVMKKNERSLRAWKESGESGGK